MHHDLKPHNVLVTGSGHCVIADYGGARFLDGDGKLLRGNNSSIVMTTSFAAPEILEPLEDGDVREYDESTDYWSLGATLITMFMPDVSRFALRQMGRTQLTNLACRNSSPARRIWD